MGYYQHREKSFFRQKAELSLAVLLLIIGLIFLVVPGLLGDAIKWLAAAAFFVTASKSLWVLKGFRQKYPRFTVFGFAVNILLLMVSLLIVTGLTHKESYKDIFVMTIFKIVGVFFIICLYYFFGKSWNAR